MLIIIIKVGKDGTNFKRWYQIAKKIFEWFLRAVTFVT